MQDKIKKIKIQSASEINLAENSKQLENLRIKYLGRRGEAALLLKDLPKFSLKQRPQIGKMINDLKKEIDSSIKTRNEEIKLKSAEEKGGEWIDLTIPGIKLPEGHLHPTTAAIQEITEIFSRIGFTRERYPEVETDWYAFEGLNMPKDHPARDEWETFFFSPKIVLTPHTSSGQLREMEKGKLPIRMINISKCYRRQSDISHTPMFYQFEGLYIDKNVSIANLKGTIDYFIKEFFSGKREFRLRPFHFRFTEPSFEIDISCDICQGKGVLENGQKCRLCKEGWLELGGAGMVHPNVLKAGKIDPKKYSGFAFGWGVERVLMMKKGMNIDDIRMIYKNDLRFLEQF
jgi:phenylalanyl-tRNA synthetase alpha chain